MKKSVLMAGFFSMFAIMGSIQAESSIPSEVIAKTAPVIDSKSFPLREKFYKVKIISTDDFFEHFVDYTVIDVRSPFEHRVMRIEGAYNVPNGDKEFVSKVKKIWNDNGKKPIVFYCYGHNCARSYDASTKIMDSAEKNISVSTYDGGITDWSEMKPEKTVLFDKPFDASKTVTSKEFKAHLLKPDDFILNASRNQDIVIIDIRDRYEMRAISLFPGREYPIGFDFDKLKTIIATNHDTHKTVYFYDESGYRVKMLQYLIKDIGLENYAFLDGGIAEYFKSIEIGKKK